MSTITYLKGDATRPVGSGVKVIAHCCNDVGAWGAGFVLALSRRWDQPEQVYRSSMSYDLGSVDFVQCEEEIWVASIIGQRGVHLDAEIPPIRYNAIRTGFATLAKWAAEHRASVHMPRLGCGLAGGKWPVIEELIRKEISARGIPVFVYDL